MARIPREIQHQLDYLKFGKDQNRRRLERKVISLTHYVDFKEFDKKVFMHVEGNSIEFKDIKIYGIPTNKKDCYISFTQLDNRNGFLVDMNSVLIVPIPERLNIRWRLKLAWNYLTKNILAPVSSVTPTGEIVAKPE